MRSTLQVTFTAAAVLFAFAGATYALVTGMRIAQSAQPRPDPYAHEQNIRDGFPVVDWQWWSKRNADIVAWITIPKTVINYPVYFSNNKDPGYYLSHDADGKPSAIGCIFLDTGCSRELFENANAVLYGHNLSIPLMFTELSSYTDESWAREHSEVLVQTMEHKVRYRVACARKANAAVAEKRTSFQSTDAFKRWRDEVFAKSSTQLVDAARSDRLLSLVVCSYTTWQNERTIAYCEPVEVDGIAASASNACELLGNANIRES